MANFTVLQEGRGIGYINAADMDLGQDLMLTLREVFPNRFSHVIVKHEIPSGVGLGDDDSWAFENAWGSDPLSSFGGVHVSSSTIHLNTAEQLTDPLKNVEVIYAPDYTEKALDILKERESLRVVKMNLINRSSVDNGLDYKRVNGGLLVQERWKTKIKSIEDLDCISKVSPNSHDLRAALLNWIVASYTRSNAVVTGSDYRTHGIGAGQQSRIDAAYMAIRKANGRPDANGKTISDSYGASGTFMASDAFMPQSDVVELASRNGIRGIVYPLGSIKDDEVLKAADDKGLVMLITRKKGEAHGGERCFTHR